MPKNTPKVPTTAWLISAPALMPETKSRVRQHDAGVVLLAAERGDQYEDQAAECADHRERHRQPRAGADQEVRDDRHEREHTEGDAGLGDDVVDGQRAGNALLNVGLGLIALVDLLSARGVARAELRVSALLLGQRPKYRVA
jgi:hypothetical protein